MARTVCGGYSSDLESPVGRPPTKAVLRSGNQASATGSLGRGGGHGRGQRPCSARVGQRGHSAYRRGAWRWSRAATSGGQAANSGVGTGTVADSSCGMTPGAPLALTIGARSNNPAPNLTAAATSLLTGAIKAHKQVSVVRLDGAPKVVFNQAFTPTGANTESQKGDYNAYVNNLNLILAGTKDPKTGPAASLRRDTAQAGRGAALLLGDGPERREQCRFRFQLHHLQGPVRRTCHTAEARQRDARHR